jgi:hypothetical protein
LGGGMTKNLIVALAASAFLLSASVLPANAGVLLSLTGVVGDSNWLAIPHPDPEGPPITPGSFELYLSLGQYFQDRGGPGGLMSITYGGPLVYFSRDEEFYSSDFQSARCEDPSGCVNGAGFVGPPDHGPAVIYDYVQGGGTSYTHLIDSSYYVDLPNLPAFAPYGTFISGSEEGYVNYIVDDIVGPDAVGQPFSLTVDIVPEAATWTLMLAGFFGIGLALRGARRKRLVTTA